MSLLNSIYTAVSGMAAQQKGLEVTGHNVANVNTRGYHRQEVVLQPSAPMPPGGSIMSPSGGQFGTGVEVGYIRRMQNAYVQQQMSGVQADLGRSATMSDALNQIEGFLAPGAGLDLSSMIDKFFGSWQELSTSPEDVAGRLQVRSDSINLANALNGLVGQLDFMHAQVNIDLQSRVDKLNQLAGQLADLNAQVGVARSEGRQPNDLLDQRQLVLEDMAALVGASSLSTDEATSITNIGGRALVEGPMAHRVVLEDGPDGPILVWADDGDTVSVPSGEIAGMYEVRSTVIPEYKRQLDDLAAALAGAVNGLHRQGVLTNGSPAGDFFSGDTAGSLRVDGAIVADVNNIATTRIAGAEGDGTLAGELYALHGAPLIGNQTLAQHSQSLIGQIGNQVLTMQTDRNASQALSTMLMNRQQEVAGVSIDEEMTNLLAYQRAYDSSARVLVTANEMLKQLIETLG